MDLVPIGFFKLRGSTQAMNLFIYPAVKFFKKVKYADFVLVKLGAKKEQSENRAVLLAASDSDVTIDAIYAAVGKGKATPSQTELELSCFHDVILSKMLENVEVADFEPASRRNVLNILSTWRVEELVSVGSRVENTDIYQDQDLLRLIVGVTGENKYHFSNFISPRIPLSWKQNKQDLQNFLGEGHPWLEPVLLYLDEIEEKRPEAEVLLSLFDSRNFFKCLHPQIQAPEPKALLMVEDASGTTAVKGFFEWDGTNETVMASDKYDSFTDIFVEHEAQVWEEHHFSAQLIEQTVPAGAPQRLQIAAGTVTRIALLQNLLTLDDFISLNQAYVQSVVDLYPTVITIG